MLTSDRAQQREDVLIRARACARDILAALDGTGPDFSAQQQTADETSLGLGSAGEDLLHWFAAKQTSESQRWQRCEEMLNSAITGVGGQTIIPTFFGGLLGVASTAEFISRDCEHAAYEPNEEVDHLVLGLLRAHVREMHFDMFRGFVGIGYYLLLRPRNAVTDEALRLILFELANRQKHVGDGFAWETPENELTEYELTHYGSSVFNLGVAHGLPGILAFLGQVAARGVEVSEATRLFNGGLRFLMTHYREEAASRFPSVVCDPPQGLTRLGWCYGDSGIAAALFTGGSGIGCNNTIQFAVRLAAHSATRSPHSSGVVEANLCHGAAGVAQVFRRFFLNTGEATFEQAADEWIEYALSLRTRQAGIAGFLSRQAITGAWRRDRGFITGVAGIGLALLSMERESSPISDYFLGFSPVPWIEDLK